MRDIVILYLMLWIICVVGWIGNIVKLAMIIDGQTTGMVILRAVGIVVAPLGVILGYI